MPKPVISIVTKARATYFKPLYEAFAKAQPAPWRTAMLWPEHYRNEHPDELVVPQGDNFDVIPVRTGGSSNSATSTRFLPSRDAIAKLAQCAPSAMLIHEFPLFSVQALVYAKWHRVPVAVSSEVGKSNAHLFSASTRLWHSFWGKWVDGIAAFSPSGLAPLSGRTIPMTTTFHAIDSRSYLPVERQDTTGSPLVFAYLGQLIHRKGLDLWLEAARVLRDSGFTHFKLRIIGGGDETWLRSHITRTGMDDHVEITGFKSGESLRTALGTSDVFVLPTRHDNYAAVVHEAACLGLPLLVSQFAGAASVLVKNDLNGYIIDPSDPQSFAARMHDFSSPEKRNAMGRASRQIGESMSAHVQGANLWNWFDQTFHLTSPA
ncbi:glycosyltransferase [Phragmitibacter flavus]|uniref:Glycosyltransferase n=1 Tax=Phragmitibacter flavus TaxID=2576071 RepID=A0A5R8KF20_9BACT|nr:glycosyltransferase [Phragmitibacter flavus]TLD70894.1 glycosyltransferase [Phragmitibacter flavus]